MSPELRELARAADDAIGAVYAVRCAETMDPPPPLSERTHRRRIMQRAIEHYGRTRDRLVPKQPSQLCQ